MVRVAAKRLAGGLLLVWLVVTTAFAILRLTPGDPARLIAGEGSRPEDLERITEQLGLNNPVWKQYIDYLSGVVRLDFGTSFTSREPVAEILSRELPNTALLVLAASLVALTVSVLLGTIVAAFTRDGRRPMLTNAFSAVTGSVLAVPNYVLAVLLILVFALWLGVLPVAGAGSWSHVVLPAAAITARPMAILTRVMRVEVLETMQQAYIKTARAKRLPSLRIYLAHVVPNAVTGVLTIAGTSLAALVGAVVVVENVFAWPGLGNRLVNAILAFDYPVTQGAVIAFGILIVMANVTVDLALIAVDPKVRAANRGVK